MKITEVTYSKGQTYQIRQFEPVNMHYSAKAEVEEGDDPSVVFAQLKVLVDRELDISMRMLQSPQRVVREAAKHVSSKEGIQDLPPF